jgi:hypothetical protein
MLLVEFVNILYIKKIVFNCIVLFNLMWLLSKTRGWIGLTASMLRRRGLSIGISRSYGHGSAKLL